MLLEDIPGALSGREIVGELIDVLEIAQDQPSAGTEGIVKLGDHALLR